MRAVCVGHVRREAELADCEEHGPHGAEIDGDHLVIHRGMDWMYATTSASSWSDMSGSPRPASPWSPTGRRHGDGTIPIGGA